MTVGMGTQDTALWYNLYPTYLLFREFVAFRGHWNRLMKVACTILYNY